MSQLTITLDTEAFAYPHIPIPPVYRVRQKVEAPKVADLEGEARRAVARLFEDPRLKPGAEVAVGVGSRGIENLSAIVRAVVSELRARGTCPFIVPAMGSHGGAVAEGQAEILRDYGVSEETMGAPVRATMEVVELARLEDGYPVLFDKNALQADAVIVINRIKHHTCFHGRIESGIAKMLAIGLGKHKGALAVHQHGFTGLRDTMPRVARRIVELAPIVGGIGILENAYGHTAEIHGLRPGDIAGDREAELLDRSRELSPRLAFDEADVLVLDQMGKDISGSGMDTHVLGRIRMPSLSDNDWPGPNVRMIVVLDLTDRTHGNASGIGLADIVTRRLVERIDFHTTFTNHRTSGEGGAWRAKLPIVLEDGEAAVKAAIGCCGRGRPETVRLVRIRNTAYPDTMEISEAMIEEARAREDIEVLGGPYAPDFASPISVG